jgi:alkaline phosphatase
MEEEACLQLLKEKVDIILGGGKKNFDMDMIRRFKQAGYEIVYTREKLLESESEKLIGLFNKSHINFVLDRKEHEPSLAEMTKKAIEILSKKEKGFFLLVEGARIDMASHNYDAPSCIYEMLEFDEAIHYAFDFARNRDDTLIIITSDHATCGLTITEEANKKLENYRLVKVSAEKMEWLVSERNLKFRDVLRDYAGVRGLGERLVEFFKDEKDKHNRICIIGDIVSKNCGITFIPIDYKFRRLNFDGKTYGHEAEMVPVYAYGKNAKIFSGTLDNVEIFSRILKASGIR